VEIAELQDLLDAHDRATAELAEALSLSPERIRLAADALAKRLDLDPLERLSAARYTPERGGGSAATELAGRCWQLVATLEGLDRSLLRYATFVNGAVGTRRREYLAAELERLGAHCQTEGGERDAAGPRPPLADQSERPEIVVADVSSNVDADLPTTLMVVSQSEHSAASPASPVLAGVVEPYENPRKGRFKRRPLFLHEVGWILEKLAPTSESESLESVSDRFSREGQVRDASEKSIKGAVRAWFGGRWPEARREAVEHYRACSPGPQCSHAQRDQK
jgi:hypothetical protein